MNARNLFLLLSILFLLHACVPASELEHEWTAPTAKKDSTKVFQKILFVALLNDEATRRVAENKLVQEVRGRGVASYTYLGQTDARSNESMIGDRLKQDGFDGVVIMRLAPVNKSAPYVPGSYPSYYNSWYGYYSSTFPRFNDPSYSLPGGAFQIEVNVYSLEQNKLLWTGITTAVNIVDTNRMIDGIIATVKDKMKSQGLLK